MLLKWIVLCYKKGVKMFLLIIIFMVLIGYGVINGIQGNEITLMFISLLLAAALFRHIWKSSSMLFKSEKK